MENIKRFTWLDYNSSHRETVESWFEIILPSRELSKKQASGTAMLIRMVMPGIIYTKKQKTKSNK